MYFQNIVGYGELVVDAIFKGSNNKLIGYNGGGSFSNVMYHLKKSKKIEDRRFLINGVVGNDPAADVAIDSLKNVGIDISYIDKKNSKTKMTFTSIKETQNDQNDARSLINCINCLEDTWKGTKKLLNKLDSTKMSNSLAIFDSIKKDRVEIINFLNENGHKIAIDIGQIGNLRYLSKDNIYNTLLFNAHIVQINGRVYDFLIKRNIFESEKEMLLHFNAEILVITNGEDGSTILINNNNQIIQKEIIFKIDSIVDGVGAGDAFFAGVIESYILFNGKVSTKEFLESLKLNCEYNVRNVLQHEGARGNIHQEEIIFDEKECKICGRNNVQKKNVIKKKKKFVMQTNLDLLERRISDASLSPFPTQINKFLNETDGRVLFVGTGASYTTALYFNEIFKMLNDHSTDLEACHPRDIYRKNINNFSNVVFFSYSGKSNDIVESIKYIKKNYKEKKTSLITQNVNSPLKNDVNNFLCYGSSNSTREKGFISIDCITTPLYYLLDSILSKTIYDGKLIDVTRHVSVKKEEEILKDNVDKTELLVDIFYDYETRSVARDLESKFIESGYGRVSIHEKKDFSHGRFSVYENFPPDLTIYLQSCDGEYEKELISYLSKKSDSSFIFIESKYTNLDSNVEKMIRLYEQIIKAQHIFNEVGRRLEKDLSKPQYSTHAMKIYKFKGEIY